MPPISRSTLRRSGKTRCPESTRTSSRKSAVAMKGARAWVPSMMARFNPPSSSQLSLKLRRYSSVEAKTAVTQKPARNGAECRPLEVGRPGRGSD